MACRSVFELVPDELLLRLFNFFELSELVVLMPVARRWNSLIIGHRTYWDDILLDSADKSPGHHAFFCLRLARSVQRPTNVSVWCEGAEIADILQHIAAHLHHIRALHITTALDQSENIFAALAQSAPILEFLNIYLLEGSTPFLPLTLPHNLLACDAPALRHVSLRNVFLPTPILPALGGVEKLAVGGKIGLIPHVWFSIPDIFTLFPALFDLTLYENVALDPSFWEESAWARIKRLTFHAGSIGRVWEHLNLPIRSIPFISACEEGNAVLSALAEHLDGALSLIFRFTGWITATRLWVIMTGSKSTRKRELFAELPQRGTQLAAHNDFWARVTSIMLPLAHWDVYVPFFGALTALEDLVLAIVGRLQLTAPLRCPRLKRLTLRERRTAEPDAVDVEALAMLAAAVLRDTPFPVDLRLINTVPRGGGSVAMRTFNSIAIVEDAWPTLGI